MKKLIDLRNINKTYRNGDQELKVLKNINLTVEEGEFVAIMGPSGSGKSTLMNIIGMLDRPSTGEYFLENEDVANLGDKKLAKVRNNQIGFVFQQFFLLSKLNALQNVELPLIYAGVSQGSRKNLAKQYLEKVDLGTRMTHLPSELSGGQKQRLSIARAVVKRPDLYIFDDSFSALDYKTDATLRRRLKEVTQDATVLIVAQRVGTIMDADQIIVLDKGEIVGRGRHEELMESNEIYREIANSQLNQKSLTED